MRALILAGATDPTRRYSTHWPGWRSASLVVAADGGARHAAPLGLPLHQVVGDFDSLSAADADELEAAGVTVSRFPTNKDATDTELALLAALNAGATEIALLCTWGGRSDHAIGTLALWRTRVVMLRPLSFSMSRRGRNCFGVAQGSRCAAHLVASFRLRHGAAMQPSLRRVSAGRLMLQSSLLAARAAFLMWQPPQSQSSRPTTAPC